MMELGPNDTREVKKIVLDEGMIQITDISLLDDIIREILVHTYKYFQYN